MRELNRENTSLRSTGFAVPVGIRKGDHMNDLNIALIEPEIPQNTGNIARTCAAVGARLHLGYRRIEYKGMELRGHEFHYSNVVAPDAMPSVAKQFTARGMEVSTPLYRYKNVIAGYTHLYWGETDILKLWKV